jgi:hypothetical protein
LPRLDFVVNAIVHSIIQVKVHIALTCCVPVESADVVHKDIS